MKSAVCPAEALTDDDTPVRPRPPAMTSCECTGRSFAEVEFRMQQDGLSTAEAEGLTGCGSICTACIPDLRSFLGRHERPHTRASKE